MTRDEIQALFDRRADAWRRRDVDALAASHAEHGVVVSPMFTTVTGRDHITDAYRSLFRAFPDWDYAGEALIVDGVRVAQPFTVQATHAGEFMGLAGSGRRFTVHGVLLFEVGDGLIQTERRIYDFTGLLIQLGVLKSRPAKA